MEIGKTTDNYDLIYMKQEDVKPLKEKIWNLNNKRCPITKLEYPLDEMVLDHMHKLKGDEPDDKKGAVRTALSRSANALAGKIENNYKRYYGANENKQPLSLPDWLRNMADYLEDDFYYEMDNKQTYFTHYTEVPKRKKVSKKEMNNIHKWYNVIYPRRTKLPKFTYINDEYNILVTQARKLNDNYGTVKKYQRINNGWSFTK